MISPSSLIEVDNIKGQTDLSLHLVKYQSMTRKIMIYQVVKTLEST